MQQKHSIWLSASNLISKWQHQVSIKGEHVEQMKTTKLLGVTFDNHLKFQTHSQQIIQKTRKTVHGLLTQKRHRVRTPLPWHIFIHRTWALDMSTEWQAMNNTGYTISYHQLNRTIVTAPDWRSRTALLEKSLFHTFLWSKPNIPSSFFCWADPFCYFIEKYL